MEYCVSISAKNIFTIETVKDPEKERYPELDNAIKEFSELLDKYEILELRLFVPSSRSWDLK